MILEETLPVNIFTKLRAQIGIGLKRVFDVMVSGLLLIFLAPFFLLLAIAIKRDSPGPVFYRGQRTGKGGRSFKILKFRTMYETDASYHGPKVTAQDDPRITHLGKWLRDTKLNELPQVWNVFRGDMSLVGPRPEDPALAKTWPRGARSEILSVRPGITSPASVLYHDEEALLTSKDWLEKYLTELSPDKLRLDQLYVRYRSAWLDFDILLWTALIMLPRIGSYSPPENLLFLGPISRFIRRYMNWFFIDLLVIGVSIGIAGLIWRIFGPLDFVARRSAGLALGFALLFSIVGALTGANRINWDKATYVDAFALAVPWVMATAIIISIDLHYRFVQGGPLLFSCGLALGGSLLGRYQRRWTSETTMGVKKFLGKKHAIQERVLIVGSGRTAEHIAWIMNHPRYATQLRIVGFIDDDLLSQGLKIYGARIVGRLKDLPQLIKKYDVGLVILADHRINYQEFVSTTGIGSQSHTRVLISPDLYGSIDFLVPDRKGAGCENGEGIDLPCARCLVKQSPQSLENLTHVGQLAGND